MQFLLVTLGVLALLALAVFTLLAIPVLRRRIAIAGLVGAMNAADGEVAVHGTGNITKLSAAAIAERYLLGEKGADNDHVSPCNAATDKAFCVITDEADAADRDINCAILGSANGTLKVRVNGNVAFGDLLVPAANGRAQALPAAAATYYIIGQSLGTAVAGELVEFSHCIPVQRIVT